MIIKNSKKTGRATSGKSTRAIPLEVSVQIRVCHQLAGLRGKELLKKFSKYCKAAVYKHARKPITDSAEEDKRKASTGMPRKLNERDLRKLNRTIKELRVSQGSFSSRKLQLEAGLNHVSNRTVRRALKSMGYNYCRSRKKGLMSKKDLKQRLTFCRKVKKRNLGKTFWRNGISFYFDATGFCYKRNPMDEATAPTAREWRLRNEGLELGCTAKGSKEGRKQAKFMVAISYGKGVVMCIHYTGRLNASTYAEFVENQFPRAFAKSSNPVSRRFLQDGCPIQNSAKAKKMYDKVGALVFSIPPRSPDINCIENFFHLVGMKLKQDTIDKNITQETYEQFTKRVKTIIKSYPIEKIDKLIDTMDKRIEMIIKAKGRRIKY